MSRYLDYRIDPNSIWAKFNISWNRAMKPAPNHGNFYMNICFFDYTAFVGKVMIDKLYPNVETACRVIENFTLEDALDLFEQAFGEYDYDNNNSFSSIAFEIYDRDNQMIAETHMFMPKE